MSGSGITIIGASAGSGKTTRLTREVIAAVSGEREPHVPVEGLFAVTYTRKAQAELTARIQQTLVERGAFTEALRLPLAMLGTVHAACLRLIQEFALDAGLSPHVDVMAGDQARMLREALDAKLPSELLERMERLAKRFMLRVDHRVQRTDWLAPVWDIMDLARGNRIAPGALPEMAERSVTGLLGLLGPPRASGEELDRALAEELRCAYEALEETKDGTKKTSDALLQIKGARVLLADGDLDWCGWAKLSMIDPSKHCDAAVVRLREVAGAYERHPQFHADLRELTSALFEAARIGLSAYAAWKLERRVVDYVDMLDSALSLIEHPRVKGELATRLRFTLVDEFQDTSPIQLALFVKLHAFTGRSVWVGDRKQCIFEYAGADPLLMDAVAGWVAQSGGRREVLPGNYRSRRELVTACSELFTSAMGRHGFARDEVAVEARREEPDELAALPPMGLWYLEGKNKEDDAESLAEGVARLLREPVETRVEDRVSRVVRDVRPGDIAVLVATNVEAAQTAAALHVRGVRVSVARAGLLQTPEGVMVDAALRFVLDSWDTLAAATLDALHGFGGQTADAWLADRVGGVEHESVGYRRALEALRAKLPVLSPSEVLEEVFRALDAVHLAARWPDAPQRVANLDALRGLAEGYEERCKQGREAATVAGLLRYFDDMGTVRTRRDEEIASDDQHVPSDDGAVVVCTYHKAKGLEWPIVILGSLDRDDRRHAFEVCPETDRAAFDPRDPLGGRWIRYWPWPFGTMKKLPLRERAEQSPEGQRVAKREEKERVRLLYVGFTRARDHLVLAVRRARGKRGASIKASWLDELAGEDGEPLLQLPVDAVDRGTEVLRIRGAGEGRSVEIGARVWSLGAGSSAGVARDVRERERPRWFARAGEQGRPRANYRIVPSRAEEDWPELALPRIRSVAPLPGAVAALRQKHVSYDVLGNAVHAFLAADTEELPEKERTQRASHLLAAAGLAGEMHPETLLGAGDRLRAFVRERWRDAVWHREVPIEALVDTSQGARRVGGVIDLLLETAEGYVIVDHKTFPGMGEGALRKKTREFLPQLAAYTEALRRVPGARVTGCWVHYPLSGAMVELGPGGEAGHGEAGRLGIV